MARDKLLLWFGSSFGGRWLHGRLHCLDELDDEEKAAGKRTKVHRVGRPLGTKSFASIDVLFMQIVAIYLLQITCTCYLHNVLEIYVNDVGELSKWDTRDGVVGLDLRVGRHSSVWNVNLWDFNECKILHCVVVVIGTGKAREYVTVLANFNRKV